MSDVAEQIEVLDNEIRRFYVADLTEHGPWIMKRLLKIYPNQNERSIIGWLNLVLDQNELLCLIMPAARAVCFAERTPLDRLSGEMVVRELFIWVEDPNNIAQINAAIGFYGHMKEWAKNQGIARVIVCERSDVPDAQVRKLGSLHDIKTLFMRV
jgi:hypothetical protein